MLRILILLSLSSAAFANCVSEVALRGLYPEIEPFETGHLPVSPTHSLYYEISGKPDGIPVLFVHGGPGGQTRPKHRRFFDPEVYKIVLIDQRGCGKSQPAGSIEDNNTTRLVEDFETLRRHLAIEQWGMVFGGSAGATFALVYAQRNRSRVRSLVVGLILLGDQQDIASIFGDRVTAYFPEAYQTFIDSIPAAYRNRPYEGLERMFRSGDPALIEQAARATTAYEGGLITNSPIDPQTMELTPGEISAARISVHYQFNGMFLRENEVLEEAPRLQGMPITIFNGRLDLLTPPINALRLREAIPHAELKIIEGTSHFLNEKMIDAVIRTTDKYAALFTEEPKATNQPLPHQKE